MTMPLNLRRRSLLILSCTICFLGSFVGKAQESQTALSMKLDTLRKDYEKLEDDWRRKMSFCIDLIDRGIIRRGAALKPILNVFGDDVIMVQGDPTSESYALVSFEKLPKGDGTRSISIPGWYLYIESSNNGNVRGYYLTNVEKWSPRPLRDD